MATLVRFLLFLIFIGSSGGVLASDKLVVVIEKRDQIIEQAVVVFKGETAVFTLNTNRFQSDPKIMRLGKYEVLKLGEPLKTHKEVFQDIYNRRKTTFKDRIKKKLSEPNPNEMVPFAPYNIYVGGKRLEPTDKFYKYVERFFTEIWHVAQWKSIDAVELRPDGGGVVVKSGKARVSKCDKIGKNYRCMVEPYGVIHAIK